MLMGLSWCLQPVCLTISCIFKPHSVAMVCRGSQLGHEGGESLPADVKNTSKAFLQELWCRWDGSPVGRERAMPDCKTYARQALPSLQLRCRRWHASGPSCVHGWQAPQRPWRLEQHECILQSLLSAALHLGIKRRKPVTSESTGQAADSCCGVQVGAQRHGALGALWQVRCSPLCVQQLLLTGLITCLHAATTSVAQPLAGLRRGTAS